MITHEVQQFYDKYPFPGSAGAYGDWQQLAPELMTHLGLPISKLKGARVLDAGCGTGEYSRSFNYHGADVTSIDYSTGAIERSKAIDATLDITGIHYQQEDILNISELGEFDFIFSLGVLHHTSDPERGFHNIRKLLKPSGYMVIGLYSNISRIHILTLRKILQIASRGDVDKAVNMAAKYCRPILRFFIGRENIDDRSRIADLLAHPNEIPLSINTAIAWFEQNNFVLTGGTPSYSVADYPLLKKIFRRDSRFARVLIQLRWIPWNADYYIIGARSMR